MALFASILVMAAKAAIQPARVRAPIESYDRLDGSLWRAMTREVVDL